MNNYMYLYHSATSIDHVYTNNIDKTMISTIILTLDILLPRALKLGTIPGLNRDGTVSSTPLLKRNKNLKSRNFNEANHKIIRQLIANESWQGIFRESDASKQYENFYDTYIDHYNKAYPLKLKANRNRRAHERSKPKPWILPWLEAAGARKQKLFHDK